MKTELNKTIEQFFQKYKLEDINFENVNCFFSDIDETNNYGNLLHAAVYQQFDENKVLQFIDVLLKNGVDVNYRGELTGYSFIHLALYGYTKDGEDYSYTTDFIIKLIKLAKKYNFDVQIVDADQDSIIHTALASEVYEGSTIEVLKALGNDYDALCKDSNGNNIYEALLEYKKEALETNDKWYKRLAMEEQSIKKLVEIEKYNSEEFKQYLKNLKTDVESILSTINIKYLLSNYSEISKKKNELELYISKQHLFNFDLTEYDNLSLNLNQILSKLIIDYIKQISQQPSYLSIQTLNSVLEAFHYQEEIELLNQIKTKYSNHIASLQTSILNCHNLNQLEQLKNQIEFILDLDIKEQLSNIYQEKYKEFDNIIQLIINLRSMLQATDIWLNQKNNNDSLVDHNELTIEQLKEMDSNLEEKLKKNKLSISKKIEQQIDDLLGNVFLLQDENIFSEVELWAMIRASFDKYQPNSKQKRKEKKNKQ